MNKPTDAESNGLLKGLTNMNVLHFTVVCLPASLQREIFRY
jgi:hypothetical protein